MANINELVCLNAAGNTGIGSCSLDIKNITGAILVPRGYEIDLAANGGDLIKTLQDACLETSKLARIFPVFDFKNTTDGSEKPVEQSFSTGAKVIVRDGMQDWTFQFTKGGFNLLQRLRKFNKSNVDFFFVDANNVLYGQKGSENTKLKAISSVGGFFYAQAVEVSDGSKLSAYMLKFVFHPKYINDYGAYVQCDFDVPTTLYGLQDVTLTGNDGGTPGTYAIEVKTSDVGTNLGDLYATELAATPVWDAKNDETGEDVTITGVTYDDNDKVFLVACDTMDSDYPGTGQHIRINLKSPSVLDAAGIEGYESTGPAVIAKN
jgi:hypothetical protein